MVKVVLKLFRSRDGEDSYAIALENREENFLARRGFGQDFEKVWSLELQSLVTPETLMVDWDTVLERAIEAYQLSDPVITNFDWPTVTA